MLWTRYRLLALVGGFCLVVATVFADPLAAGYGWGAVAAFIGAEYLLLALYAGLNGARPVRATLAALNSHLTVFSVLALVTFLVVSEGTLPTVTFERLVLALVLLPVPAAFSLGASTRATDRGAYLLGAIAVSIGGPILANVLLQTMLGVDQPELATLSVAAVAVVAAVPPYLSARRRKPGFRDRYPSLDELPVSRPTLTVLLWGLLVISGWGPIRVASGTAFQRAWGIIPPSDVLAVPFFGLMGAVGVFAAGSLDAEDGVERTFAIAVIAYLVGALIAYLAAPLGVDLAPPRYLGFGAVLLVTGLAVAVLVRRAR